MIQCRNCGTIINEGETSCPNCGAALQQIQNQNLQQNNQPQQVEPQPVAANTQTSQPKEKDIRKILIPILSILIIVLLGVIIYSVAFNKNDTSNVEKTENNTENNSDNAQKTNSVEYAGYKFSLPDGYQSIISNIYGLVIYNSEIAYTVGVDYSNNYDLYKNAFITYAPQLESSLFTTFMDKEYLIYNLTDTDLKGSQYETKADDNTTFTGLVVKNDNTIPTGEEINPIANILASAIKISTDDTNLKGTSNDFGTSVGIMVYQINPNEFPFQINEIKE